MTTNIARLRERVTKAQRELQISNKKADREFIGLSVLPIETENNSSHRQGA